jgi:predicted NBD/HSP70 family sugar kinase
MGASVRGVAGEKNLLKRLNRAAILRLVWQQPGISRSAVAQHIGITKSTVSQSVGELEALGWLESGGSDTTAGLGRPSIPLRLAVQNLALIGAEVGVSEINVVATDIYGNVLAQRQQQGNYQQVSRALDDLTSGIKTVLKSQELMKRSVLGVGVGVPGPVDPEQGLVLHAPNLGWKRIALHTMLLERLPLDNLFVDNDANMAVFAEYMFGRHKQSADLMYLYIETGIGAGLILGHQLYRGRRGFAGEVGHMTVLPGGSKCSCGNQGCAETLFSTWVLLEQYKKETGQAVDLPELLHRLERGDMVAKRILQKAGMYLGIFLGSLANVFDPKLMVIGGAFAKLGAHILEPAEREIHKRLFGDEFRTVQLEPCEFGSNAGAVGAAGYIWHQLLQNAEELPTLKTV